MDVLKNRELKENNDLIKNKKVHIVELHLLNGELKNILMSF